MRWFVTKSAVLKDSWSVEIPTRTTRPPGLLRLVSALFTAADSSAGRGGGGGGGRSVAEKVQPNLVTRDGELEKELERMRVLLVRVAGRVAQLPDPDPVSEGDAVMEDVESLERSKVERLLDGF